MKIFKFLVVMLAMYSCQAREDSLQSSIESMEEQIREHLEMDTAVAKDLTAAYIEYADANPADSLSPVYLSRAADIYKEMSGRELRAVNVYNRIIVEYPEHQLVPRSIFMIGYVFDEKFDDKERAEKSYQHFLENYPQHELADDARNLLALVQDTLTDEEMVAKWMQQNKQDTTNP